jgi:hypothetical protein
VGRIRPSAVSRSMRSRLIFDQTLFARRGVNRCTYHSSSIRRAMPSIQPKQSATSTAVVQLIDVTPEPLLAIRIQTCVAVDALSSSQVSNALSFSKYTAAVWSIDMAGA